MSKLIASKFCMTVDINHQEKAKAAMTRNKVDYKTIKITGNHICYNCRMPGSVDELVMDLDEHEVNYEMHL